MNPTRRLLLKLIPASLLGCLGLSTTKAQARPHMGGLPNFYLREPTKTKVRVQSFSDPRARVSYDGTYYNDKLVKVRVVFKHKTENSSYSEVFRLNDRHHVLKLFRLDLTNALTLQECKVHWGLISFLWASGLNEEYRRDQPIVTVYHAVGERYRQTARIVELLRKPFA